MEENLSTNEALNSTLSKNYSTINDSNEINSRPKSSFSNLTTKYQGVITIVILFLLSVINITDRYAIGSVIIDIEAYFKISKSTGGLLQTAFMLNYMAFSPLNGYLGDRVNRKYLLSFGILIWLTATISGSLVTEKQFVLFVLSRCLFGIATASFETIAVPIIGDRFYNNQIVRNRAIILFCCGPPVGTGLSYLIATIAKDLEPNDWRYTLRFTPFFLFLTLLLILVAYKEPERIKKLEIGSDDESRQVEAKKGGFLHDLKTLSKNKSYLLLIGSWTFGLSALGAFSWWSSSIIDYSLRIKHLSSSQIDNFKKIYSIMQVVCGVIGLLIPVKIVSYFKQKSVQNIDCLLLSLSFFFASLFTYIYLVTLEYNVYFSLIIYSLIIVSYNLCWIIQSYIFLDIIQPSLRSTANGMIICVLHFVGDSVSPYWVGLIADICLKNHEPNQNTVNNLLACQRLSFYPLVFVSFFGAALGLFLSLTFVKDKEKAQKDF